MNPMMQTELNIVIPLAMEIAGLALAVFIDPNIPQKKTAYFIFNYTDVGNPRFRRIL